MSRQVAWEDVGSWLTAMRFLFLRIEREFAPMDLRSVLIKRGDLARAQSANWVFSSAGESHLRPVARRSGSFKKPGC